MFSSTKMCLIVVALVFSGLNLLIVGTNAITELEYLNASVDPCDNFYEFTCGNFKNVHPRPEHKPFWDHFEILRKETHNLIKFILESPRKQQDPIALRKAKVAYKACVDTAYSDSLVLPELTLSDKVGGWPLIDTGSDDVDFSWNDIGDLVAEFGIQMLFNVQVSVNPFDATKYILYLGIDRLPKPSMVHPGPSPDKDVDYLNDNNSTPYEVFLNTVALKIKKASGSFKPDELIRKDIMEVVDFMKTLQKGGIQPSGEVVVDRINPNVTLKELQEWTDRYFDKKHLKLDWVQYLGRVVKLSGVEVTEETRIMAPTGNHLIFYGILNLVARTHSRVLKNFAFVRLVTFTAPDSDSEMRGAFETLYKDLNLTLYPRQEYCIRKVLDTESIGFSMALTYEYQRYHFNVNKLTLAHELIEDLKDSFRDILHEADWMDDTTREKALQKAAKMIILLGYPDYVEEAAKLDDFYKNVRMCSWDHFGNSQRLRAFRQALQYSFLRKEVDKTSWMLSPLEPNAYYNKQYNRILLPVIMLNPVFFNGNLSILDYGRLGAIIGHEITHGYDSRGKLHDGDGHSNSWWTPETNESYHRKVECFKEQYNNYYIEEIDKYVDGEATLDENLADNGGLREAYKAFEKLAIRNFPLSGAASYTPEQLFFIGFGTMWCTTETADYLEKNNSNSYAPGRFRVNGPVSNMREFAEAFKCPLGSKMNPKKKCILW